jgi:hypothetical protein
VRSNVGWLPKVGQRWLAVIGFISTIAGVVTFAFNHSNRWAWLAIAGLASLAVAATAARHDVEASGRCTKMTSEQPFLEQPEDFWCRSDDAGPDKPGDSFLDTASGEVWIVQADGSWRSLGCIWDEDYPNSGLPSPQSPPASTTVSGR